MGPDGGVHGYRRPGDGQGHGDLVEAEVVNRGADPLVLAIRIRRYRHRLAARIEERLLYLRESGVDKVHHLLVLLVDPPPVGGEKGYEVLFDVRDQGVEDQIATLV